MFIAPDPLSLSTLSIIIPPYQKKKNGTGNGTWNGTDQETELPITGNIALPPLAFNVTTPPEHFFFDRVLGITAGIDVYGPPRWELTLVVFQHADNLV